jgi:hypothetical protein
MLEKGRRYLIFNIIAYMHTDIANTILQIRTFAVLHG